MIINIHERTIEIHDNKKYAFPNDITAKYFKGFMLVISSSTGKWIVLNSQIQIDILKSLINGASVREVIDKFENINEIRNVLTQLEGKLFTEKISTEEQSFALRIYLTNNCNLRCRHCFMYASTAMDNELSTAEITDLITNCKSYGCSKVIFTGGEVLMREDFDEIAKFSALSGLYVQVLTNGTLWNEENIARIAPCIDEIQISIDGFNQETNSAIRGENTFEKSLRTLELFTEHENVLTSIVMTPTYELLEKFKAQYTEFAQNLVNKYQGKNFLVVLQKELIDGRELKSNESKNRIMEQTVASIYEKIYENSELTTFILNHKNGRIYKNCGYGNLTVNSIGDIFFCGRVHDVKKYANLRTTDFSEIMRLRKFVRERSFVDYLQPCCECELRYICGGGCRIKNFPEIVNSPLENLTNTFSRKIDCSEHDKENFYRLMIESNNFLME